MRGSREAKVNSDGGIVINSGFLLKSNNSKMHVFVFLYRHMYTMIWKAIISFAARLSFSKQLAPCMKHRSKTSPYFCNPCCSFSCLDKISLCCQWEMTKGLCSDAVFSLLFLQTLRYHSTCLSAPHMCITPHERAVPSIKQVTQHLAATLCHLGNKGVPLHQLQDIQVYSFRQQDSPEINYKVFFKLLIQMEAYICKNTYSILCVALAT